MMRIAIAIACVLGLAAAAHAQVPLANAGIEDNPDNNAEFSSIAPWGPNGGWGYHANFPAGNNGSLDERFGFYSAGGAETVGQIPGTLLAPDTTYTFASYAIGGGNRTGTVPYQIGYAATDDDISSFVELATNAIDLTGNQDWILTQGVSYTTGAAGPELGKQLIVRLGDLAAGGDSDIWFDNMTATPEPASLSFLLLGAGLLIRRR